MARSVAAELARSHLPPVCESMPVFPLPGLVLMPGALVPLHVFEPRYREMIRFCVSGDRVLGIATLRPGYEDDYEGSPALFPELGLGLIVAHHPFEDGRSNIVVEHLARARVLEEVPSEHSFRLVRARLRPDDDVAAPVAIAQLKALLLQLAALKPGAQEEASRIAALPDAEMVDALALRLLDEPDDQRHYLTLDRLMDRASLVTERMGAVLSPSGTPSAQA